MADRIRNDAHYPAGRFRRPFSLPGFAACSWVVWLATAVWLYALYGCGPPEM